MNVYQVLKRPILTEKTDYQRDNNQYIFEVDRRANKHQIRQAVEELFKVKVVRVNTMNVRGKLRRQQTFQRVNPFRQRFSFPRLQLEDDAESRATRTAYPVAHLAYVRGRVDQGHRRRPRTGAPPKHKGVAEAQGR